MATVVTAAIFTICTSSTKVVFLVFDLVKAKDMVNTVAGNTLAKKNPGSVQKPIN